MKHARIPLETVSLLCETAVQTSPALDATRRARREMPPSVRGEPASTPADTDTSTPAVATAANCRARREWQLDPHDPKGNPG